MKMLFAICVSLKKVKKKKNKIKLIYLYCLNKYIHEYIIKNQKYNHFEYRSFGPKIYNNHQKNRNYHQNLYQRMIVEKKNPYFVVDFVKMIFEFHFYLLPFFYVKLHFFLFVVFHRYMFQIEAFTQ